MNVKAWIADENFSGTHSFLFIIQIMHKKVMNVRPIHVYRFPTHRSCGMQNKSILGISIAFRNKFCGGVNVL